MILEIVAGIVDRPVPARPVEADQAISVVALIGLTFVLFLAGLEIDFDVLRGPVLRLAAGRVRALVRPRRRRRRSG